MEPKRPNTTMSTVQCSYVSIRVINSRLEHSKAENSSLKAGYARPFRC